MDQELGALTGQAASLGGPWRRLVVSADDLDFILIGPFFFHNFLFNSIFTDQEQRALTGHD